MDQRAKKHRIQDPTFQNITQLRNFTNSNVIYFRSDKTAILQLACRIDNTANVTVNSRPIVEGYQLHDVSEKHSVCKPANTFPNF